MYIFIYVKIFLSFIVGQKREKVNILKELINKEIYILLKIIYLVLPRVSRSCFLQRTFKDFSGVGFGIYSTHYFDGMVVSLNFVIDSL